MLPMDPCGHWSSQRMEIHDGNHVRPAAYHVLCIQASANLYPLLRIPVYVINALYLWPITLWTYLNYGRPAVPREEGNAPSHCAHSPSDASAGGETEKIRHPPSEEMRHNTRESHEGEAEPEKSEPHDSRASENRHEGHDNDGGHGHGGERPMFATITVAVCHCGAGCVLGDVIGEWLVYGTRATIHGRTLWPAYLIGE